MGGAELETEQRSGKKQGHLKTRVKQDKKLKQGAVNVVEAQVGIRKEQRGKSGSKTRKRGWEEDREGWDQRSGEGCGARPRRPQGEASLAREGTASRAKDMEQRSKAGQNRGRV